MWSNDWVALIVLVGVCLLSLLWTALAAPGFKVRGRHVLLTGRREPGDFWMGLEALTIAGGHLPGQARRTDLGSPSPPSTPRPAPRY